MKTYTEINQPSLYKIFEKLKEYKQANLFDIAIEQVDLYIDMYDHADECDYIKTLKKHDLSIELAMHLGSNTRRSTGFDFNDELKKVNKRLIPVKRYIYNQWRFELLNSDTKRLNHPTKEIKQYFEELVIDFTPYHMRDKKIMRIKLGLKR